MAVLNKAAVEIDEERLLDPAKNSKKNERSREFSRKVGLIREILKQSYTCIGMCNLRKCTLRINSFVEGNRSCD